MAKIILIVDDDANILDTARDILEDAGYTVLTESTAAGALARQKTTPADLALLDFNLADGKGAELALKLKSQSPQIVNILLTGEENVDLGPAQMAISGILTKPVNPAKLLSVLRGLVDS